MNSDDRRSNRIRELETSCAKYATEIARLEFKIGELNSEISRLHAELNQRRGARQATHTLYRAVDDAIIARIDKRGYARKKPRLHKVEIAAGPDTFAVLSKAELLALAAAYDTQSYFQLHSPRTAMRLQYRILSKAYRTLRDIALFGAKKTYRLARRVAR